jgi:hypothetical protein
MRSKCIIRFQVEKLNLDLIVIRATKQPMRSRFTAFALLLAILGFKANSLECVLPGPPALIRKNLWVWNFSSERLLTTADIALSPGYLSFFEWARLQPNLSSPGEKILAEREAYAKAGLLTPALIGRLDPILAGSFGRLAKASCLETLLIGEAHALRSMSLAPYEFAAVLIGHGRDYRLYLTLGDETSVDSSDLESEIARELIRGWKLLFHLHNHPFSLEEPYILHSGYTAPSQGDLSFYKSWSKKFQLPEARITNGVFSLILRSDEFLP